MDCRFCARLVPAARSAAHPPARAGIGELPTDKESLDNDISVAQRVRLRLLPSQRWTAELRAFCDDVRLNERQS
jgi:hypothetical protein